jgi:hypothetical protein
MTTNAENFATSTGQGNSTENQNTIPQLDAESTSKRRAISREQRSEAAKRGWITRKKRKP